MQRVVDLFVAPTRIFRDILRSTTWWLPFVLIAAVNIGVTLTIDHKVGFERVVENVLHEAPKQEESMAQFTPEQRTTQIRRMATGYRYTSYASPVLVLASAAVAAFGLWASFNFGLGSETTFAQMFCLCMYASLPRLIGGCLTVVVLLAGGDAESFNLKDPVGTNIGYYVGSAAPWLKTALGFVDLIGLWVLLLLVTGTAIVAKVSRGKAAAVVVGWWLIFLLVSVAFAAAF